MNALSKIKELLTTTEIPPDPWILNITGVNNGRRITPWMKIREALRAWRTKHEETIALLIIVAVVGSFIIWAARSMQ